MAKCPSPKCDGDTFKTEVKNMSGVSVAFVCCDKCDVVVGTVPAIDFAHEFSRTRTAIDAVKKSD